MIIEQLPTHLTPNERAGLVKFVSQLWQRYKLSLLRVVLFGSKARGSFDNESDLDVLVVIRMPEKEYWRYWKEIVKIAWNVELEYNLVFSLMVKSELHCKTMFTNQSLLAQNIEQDGLDLWTTQQNEPTFKPI